MRYVEARIDEFQREETYRYYVAKSLQLAPQSKFITTPYEDILNPKREVDTRSGDEIIEDVMRNAGLSFGE